MTTQTQRIELYYAATPNGRKATIMLEELGVPYHLNYVRISRGEQFRPEFLAISPNNKIPAIVDPEGPGGTPISIFESGAILKYLGGKFGRFYPVDPRAQVEVDQWLFWQVAGFGPMLGQAAHFLHDAPTREAYAVQRFSNEAQRLYRVLDTHLAGRDYVAGDYSIADIALFGWATRNHRHGIDIAAFPNVVTWLERIGARPAVQAALAIPEPAAPVAPAAFGVVQPAG
ncbi:glutathione S-transferase family protein [Devosia sp.]|uniref:glutathione S-transferase family protein n=1 Tax=Devosia sp. TaxID=1871048 RepID=UPI002F19B53D